MRMKLMLVALLGACALAQHCWGSDAPAFGRGGSESRGLARVGSDGPAGPATTVEGFVTLQGKFTVALTRRVHTFHDVLGRKGFDLEVRPFVGIATSDHGAGSLGGALDWSHPLSLAREASLKVGVFGQMVNGTKPQAGLHAVLTFAFSD